VSDYVAGRLQEVLAHAGETDVHVAIADERVVLTGNVATDERHAEVLELAHRTAEGHEVVDGITVLHVPEPSADGQEAIS
jgi:Flp pilus assembly secretin CpaC